MTRLHLSIVKTQETERKRYKSEEKTQERFGLLLHLKFETPIEETEYFNERINLISIKATDKEFFNDLQEILDTNHSKIELL